VQNHRNLIAWQKAHGLAVSTYKATRKFARIDRSGIAAQAQRAAQSVAANIAEGCNRSTSKDFAKFLRISIASSSELEDHLQFAQDVGLLPSDEAASTNRSHGGGPQTVLRPASQSHQRRLNN
jgi:four helix bundle protein